jgi:hypothetical protein
MGSRKPYIHLKSRTILSRPTRKPDSVSSLAVVVHSMRTLKKWQKRALRRWKEMPPKKRRKKLLRVGQECIGKGGMEGV